MTSFDDPPPMDDDVPLTEPEDDDDDVSIALDANHPVVIADSPAPRPDGDLLHLLATQGSRKFHRRVAVLVTGWMWFMSGAATSLTLFTTLEPPRFPICLPDELVNDPSPRLLQDLPCNPTVPLPPTDCSTPYHYNHKGVSVVSEFDVPVSACEVRPWKNVSWVHSAYFVGVLLGALFFAPFSDKIGRIPVLSFGVLVLVGATVVSMFSVDIVMYGLSRIVVGIGSTCGSLPAFVLLSEIVPNRARTQLILVQALSFASAAAFISGLAAFIPSWRMLTLISIMPALWFLTGCICCTGVYIESPKWLAVRGNMAQAFNNWLKVAKMNNIELDESIDLERFTRMELETAHNLKLRTQEDLDEELALMSIQHLASPDTTRRVFSSFPTSVWLIVCAMLWIVCATVYYGVLLDYTDVTQAIFGSFNQVSGIPPPVIPPVYQLNAMDSETATVRASMNNPPAVPAPGARRLLQGAGLSHSWLTTSSSSTDATSSSSMTTNSALDSSLDSHVYPLRGGNGGKSAGLKGPPDSHAFAWVGTGDSEDGISGETEASSLVVETDEGLLDAAKKVLASKNWTMIPPEMKEPLLNYVKALEGYVKNSTSIILDQARHLPETANRIYGQTKDSGTVKDFLQDVSAQFQEADPMAPYWKQARLQSALVMVSFLLEFPMYVIVMKLAAHHWFGRKWCVVTFLLAGGICLALGGAATNLGAQGEQQGMAVLVFIVLGRCMVAGVFQLLYLYTAELVPTSVRTSVIGTMSAFARIGCITAGPLAKSLDAVSRGTTLFVFGMVTVMASLIVITTLPETNGLQLFDTYDTLDLHYKKSGFYERFTERRIHRIVAWIATRFCCCVGRFMGRKLGLPHARDLEPADFESKGRAWLKRRIDRRSERSTATTRSMGMGMGNSNLFGSGSSQPRRFMLLTDGSNSSFGGDNMPSTRAG